MKRYSTLIFLMVLIVNSTIAQNVNIPDTIFKKALLENTGINLNGDDEIQLTEAQSYTGEIKLQELGITDMTGIEAFINITSLNCNYNSLIKLDVSNNTSLTLIQCIWNHTLENLILGSKPSLITLACYGNNLRKIDVENITSLENLICGFNPLKTIDLSKNSNLITVDIRESELMSVDIRNGNNTAITKFYIPNNPDLTCVNVDDVSYSSANWTDVDPWVEFSTDCFPYNVTFKVDDGSDPINEATIKMVTIDEVTLTTDASGEAICNEMGKGEFIYKVEALGYKGIVGKFSITDSNVFINVSLAAGITDTVDIPDNNFRQKLLNDTAININNDQYIQVTEAQYYKGSINVMSSKINKLKGIEVFINISSLDCSQNSIDSLDLTANTELITLNCMSCSIDTLIFGNNDKLSSVVCYDNNITGLDLSRLISLEGLTCNANKLTGMDLSKNPLIKSLNCSNCKLSNLDMRNGNNSDITYFNALYNPDLSCISVDDISYSVANWTRIDEGVIFSADCSVSFDVTFVITDGTNPIENAYIKFNGIYFATNSDGKVVINGVGYGNYIFSVIAEKFQSIIDTVDISDNNTINIILSSGTPGIVYIPDYHFRTVLLKNTSLNVNSDNEIQVSEATSFSSALDVSSLGIIDMTGIEAFTNITSLNCSYNELIELDVSNNILLTNLLCTWNHIDTMILGSKTLLTTLLCYNNNMSVLNIDNLIALKELICGMNLYKAIDLSHNPNLEIVDIRGCNLTSLDIRNGNNKAITKFYIPDNPELTCVNVDDVSYSSANWTDVDSIVIFSLNCADSDDATLMTLKVNNVEVSGFQANVLHYDVELNPGTNIPPTISAVANNENASITITQADSVNGTATVEVISENGLSVSTYTISFSVLLGLNKESLSVIKLFPNPVEDYLVIEGINASYELIIFNVSGEVIKQYNHGYKVLDTSTLPSGIYFIGIVSGNYTRYLKFVKK